MKMFHKAGAAVALMATSVASQAAIVAGDLTTPLAAVTTDANTVFTAVLPIILAVVGLSVGISLLKRFTGKI